MKKYFVLFIVLIISAASYSQGTVNQLYPCIDDDGNFVKGCRIVSLSNGRYIEAKLDTARCIGVDLERSFVAINTRLGQASGNVVLVDTLSNACTDVDTRLKNPQTVGNNIVFDVVDINDVIIGAETIFDVVNQSSISDYSTGADIGAQHDNGAGSTYNITFDTIPTKFGWRLSINVNGQLLELLADTLATSDSTWRANYIISRGDTVQYTQYYRSAATGQIDTFVTVNPKDTLVGGYSSLRSLPGKYISDFVYLNDWIARSASDSTSIVLGGPFYKASGCLENGSTCIVASDGTTYKRHWDNIHFQPDWFEFGGYDSRGQPYVDHQTLSPLSNPASDDFFYDGIYSDADKFQHAVFVVGSGGVIENLKDSTYYINKQIKANGYSLIWNFNNSTWERPDSPVKTLTTTINIGDSILVVDNTDGISIGQTIYAFDCNATYGGLAEGEHTGTGNFVVAITPTTIKMSGVANRQVLSGCPVMTTDHFIQNGTNNFQFIEINNGIFRGNKSNGGQATRFSQDWRIGNTALLGSGAFGTLNNCRFYDTPSENITLAAGIMNTCLGERLDGSLIHGSMNDNTYAAFPNTGITLIDCRVDSVNMATDAVAGHTESVVVSSLHTEFVKIIGCTFKNGSEGILPIDPIQLNTKGYLSLFNNTFINFNNIFKGLGTGTISQTEREDAITFTGNHFNNCGIMVLWGHNARQGLSINGIQLKNNIFTNTRLDFRNCTNLSITGNEFNFIEEGLSGFSALPQSEQPTFSLLSLKNVLNVDISGNQFENNIDNDTIAACINFNAIDCLPLKDAAGVDTDFYWEQNINISGNDIVNFHTGITGIRRLGDNLSAFSNIRQTVGWRFNDNYIALRSDSISVSFAEQITFGIGVPQGVQCWRNIISQHKDDSNQSLIFAHGHVIPGFGGNADKYEAGNVQYNKLFGFPGGSGSDIIVGKSANQEYNIIVKYNEHVRPIGGFPNALRNKVVDNTQIDSSYLLELTNPQPLLINRFELNKGVY